MPTSILWYVVISSLIDPTIEIFLQIPHRTQRVEGSSVLGIDGGCVYRQPDMTAFAYRVHTHSAGLEVWGKKLDKDDNTKETLLGTRSPQLPQVIIRDSKLTIELLIFFSPLFR